jgi:aldehyde:ferredoxin oxidoreductase
MNLKELWQLVNAATGFEYSSVKEFEQVGERINTLCRLFNVREGFDRKQDTLPARNLTQPLADGPAKGQVVELEMMLDDYYARMGWDKTGIPTLKRLSELGLDQLSPVGTFLSGQK